MKVGDLIRYFTGDVGVALTTINEGGTIKVLLGDSSTTWFVASQCKVISAMEPQCPNIS